MRKHLFLIIFLGLAMPALAQDVPPVKPPEITAVIQADSPYGAGTYSYLTVAVYDAALWTDAPGWSLQSPFALSLHYDIDIDRRELVDKSLDEMNDQQTLSAPERDAYRALLLDLLVPVAAGDRMTALYIPGTSLAFYHNGQLTGTTGNMPFARRFLDIWLSPRTSSPDLRARLLALKG